MEAVSPVMPGSEPIELVLGAGQQEYNPLPCVYLSAPSVPMISRWRLSDEERALIADGADIVLTELTFGYKFQPVHLQVVKPDAMPEFIE